MIWDSEDLVNEPVGGEVEKRKLRVAGRRKGVEFAEWGKRRNNFT